MNYELYRRSSLGLALTDALDELVQNQQLTPNLGLKVMAQFDKVMTEALNNKVKVRGNLKGHLHTYRFCDDVWTFIVENCVFKLDDETVTADKVKIVSCNAKKGEVSN